MLPSAVGYLVTAKGSISNIPSFALYLYQSGLSAQGHGRNGSTAEATVAEVVVMGAAREFLRAEPGTKTMGILVARRQLPCLKC